MIDTFEIDHSIDEICKVKIKTVGTKDKLVHLRWIVNIISTAKKDVPWATSTSS